MILEVDVALEGLLYPAAGIDVVHVGVDDNLQQHLRIIRTASALPVQFAETAQVEALYYAADKADWIIFRNVFVDSLRKKYRLIW